MVTAQTTKPTTIAPGNAELQLLKPAQASAVAPRPPGNAEPQLGKTGQRPVKHPNTSFLKHLSSQILLLITLLCAFPTYADELTASVDRNQLGINETFILTLRYNGNENRGEPDFQLLEQDFEILSRQQSNQYRVINGHAESFVEWTLSLAPLKQGKLFVPSLHFHGNVSDAIPITVSQAGKSPGSDNQQAFLEVELDKETLHVQEQLLVKVRLYTTIGLHDIATEPLEIPGAHVEKVDEQRYERRIDGVGHAVYELSYAVFPESSGELQIPALNYVAVAGRRDPFSLFNRNAQRLRLRSEPKTVTVQPKPATYSGSHWLPAASLGLVQSWSKDPDSFKVGEPITRIITLRAEGLRAAQLPPLPELNIEGLKTYPDQPQQEDQPGNNGITGSRIETTAIVATKPGDYQLPAMTITWWDTKSGQQRATQLPVFRFTVAGAPITSAQTTTAEITPDATSASNDNRFWQTLAIAALGSHLLWLLYFWRRRPAPSESRSRPEANTTSQQQALALQEAAVTGDAQEIHRTLQDWLTANKSLLQSEDEELEKLRGLLNAALYQTPPKPLNRQQVQIMVERLLKRKAGGKETKPAAELPDLFA